VRDVRREDGERAGELPALCWQDAREESGGRPPGVRQGDDTFPLVTEIKNQT